MPTDIERLLRRVVGQVFGDTGNVEFFSHPKHANDWRALVASPDDSSREVEIRATDEWFSSHIPAHDCGTIVFEYDDDDSAKEDGLRELALVMLTYVKGGGSVGCKTSWIRRRKRPFVTIDRDGKRWILGPGPGRSSIMDLRQTD